MTFENHSTRHFGQESRTKAKKMVNICTFCFGLGSSERTLDSTPWDKAATSPHRSFPRNKGCVNLSVLADGISENDDSTINLNGIAAVDNSDSLANETTRSISREYADTNDATSDRDSECIDPWFETFKAAGYNVMRSVSWIFWVDCDIRQVSARLDDYHGLMLLSILLIRQMWAHNRCLWKVIKSTRRDSEFSRTVQIECSMI